MSERGLSFVPINELTTPRMRVVLPLPPFVDQSQILVNERAIDRLCGIAWIRHLKIVASEDGKTSGFVPTIVGFDANGGAYAGKTGLKNTVPEYLIENEGDNSRLFNRRKINGTISINLDEMAKRISQETKWKGGVQSPQPWAYHLNRNLKGGISEIGLKHLIADFTRKDLLAIGLCQSIVLSSLIFSQHQLWDRVLAALGFNVVGNIMIYLETLGTEHQTRFSLIYGPQIDRALIFGSYLATQTLVKASQA